MASLVLISSWLSACVVDDEGGRYHRRHTPAPPASSCDSGRPERAEIDAGAALEVDAGAGAGVFIEYQSGGRFRVYLACDTAISGLGCAFDVIVRPLSSATIEAVTPDALENDDTLTVGARSAHLTAHTEYDLDGFYLNLPEGTGISVDAVLDGACANPYVYWVGQGAIHEGAPTNPIELVPSAP